MECRIESSVVDRLNRGTHEHSNSGKGTDYDIDIISVQGRMKRVDVKLPRMSEHSTRTRPSNPYLKREKPTLVGHKKQSSMYVPSMIQLFSELL